MATAQLLYVRLTKWQKNLEPLIGRTPEEVAHLVEPWVEDYIEPIIFSDATRTIAAHRKAGDRDHFSAQQFHAEHVRLLALDVGGAHVDHTLHPKSLLSR